MKSETTGVMVLEALQTLCALHSPDWVVQVDIQDVEPMLREAKAAFAATGSSRGEKRIESAAEDAMQNLRDRGLNEKAKGLIILVHGNKDENLAALETALCSLSSVCVEDAGILWGYRVDETLRSEAHVSVVATV
jgi:cell division protein FtsZ